MWSSNNDEGDGNENISQNAIDLNEHNNNFAWASGFMLTSLLSVIVELRLETY